MWYTFKQGKYDFGAAEKGTVKLSHDTDYLDAFYMVNDGPVALLNDFYQLTGNPVLLPKFGFYQGHLNAYNRDYWVEDEKGILFEDGKRYKQYKFTPAELNGIYGNEYKHAVALVKIYADNNRITASEVVETKYIVGIVDGCWFISDELKKRRRIDTNGVEILCHFPASDTVAVDDIIKAHKKKLQELDSRHTEIIVLCTIWSV